MTTNTCDRNQASSNLPPAILSSNGPISAILYRTRQAANETAEAREIHLRSTADLDALRIDYSTGFQCIGGSTEQRLIGVLTDLSPWCCEPLLRFCIAKHEKLDQVCDFFLNIALKKYRGMPGEYKTVLAELIPADMDTLLAPELDLDAYYDGTSPTALGDWSPFLAILKSQRVGDCFLPGIMTGLPKLDAALGGLRGLTLIAGGKGVGKSALTLWIAYCALAKHPDLGVMVYSLDMDKTPLYQRLLSLAAEVDYRELFVSAGNENMREQLRKASQHLRTTILPRLRVHERRMFKSTGLSFDLVWRQIHEFKEAAGVSNVLLIFDLFQRIDIPSFVSSDGDNVIGRAIMDAEADNARLDLFKRLQAASRYLDLPSGYPMLVVSETRKSDSSRHGLSYDDLLGSTRLASDADSILLLSPKEEGKKSERNLAPLNLTIAKGRDGVERGELSLWFEHKRTRFYDVEPNTSKTVDTGSGNRRRKLQAPGISHRTSEL